MPLFEFVRFGFPLSLASQASFVAFFLSLALASTVHWLFEFGRSGFSMSDVGFSSLTHLRLSSSFLGASATLRLSCDARLAFSGLRHAFSRLVTPFHLSHAFSLRFMSAPWHATQFSVFSVDSGHKLKKLAKVDRS